MKQDKKIKKFKAAQGRLLPLFYKGSIIRIVEDDAIEIDMDALDYEPRFQLETAIRNKHVLEVGEK